MYMRAAKALVLVFIYIHTLCVRAAKALTSLHFCADLLNQYLLWQRYKSRLFDRDAC